MMDNGLSPKTPDSAVLPARGEPRDWLATLEERTLPHFNQFIIWVLLASGVILTSLPFRVSAGDRQGHATLLFWLPDAVLDHPALFWGFRVVLLAGVLMWARNYALPWSCWLVVVGYTGLWSMHVENTTNTAHIFNMANMLLVIQAIWITADARLIRERLRAGTFWRLPLVPRWVSLASIAYIGLFHTAAGISKLAFSGPAWASGTSLQIWTYLWGRRWSPTTQLMLSSRSFTQGLQILTLVMESAGVLAIVPRLRLWIGLGLVAFYVGVLATFDYGFQLNALLTALYFLPVESWLTRRAARCGEILSDPPL